MNEYLNVIRNNYANFTGRARRREYWMFALLSFAVAMISVILMFAGGMGAAGGITMDSMMPKGVSLKIKGGSSLSVIEGGMTAGEVLTLADKNVAYLIDRPSRTYSTLNQNSAAALAPSGRYKITKTGETTTILGYSCTKTLVEETGGRGAATTYTIWSTNAIAGANSKQFSQLKLTQGGDSSFMSAKIGRAHV